MEESSLDVFFVSSSFYSSLLLFILYLCFTKGEEMESGLGGGDGGDGGGSEAMMQVRGERREDSAACGSVSETHSFDGGKSKRTQLRLDNSQFFFAHMPCVYIAARITFQRSCRAINGRLSFESTAK